MSIASVITLRSMADITQSKLFLAISVSVLSKVANVVCVGSSVRLHSDRYYCRQIVAIKDGLGEYK